jgi:hypothetical protein
MLGNTRRIRRFDPPVSITRSADVGGPTKPNPATFSSPATGLASADLAPPASSATYRRPWSSHRRPSLVPPVTAAAPRPRAAALRRRSSGHPPPPLLLERAATAARPRCRSWRCWLRYPKKARRLWRSSTRQLWRPPTPELAGAMDFPQGLSRIILRNATIKHIVCYNCSESLR